MGINTGNIHTEMKTIRRYIHKLLSPHGFCTRMRLLLPCALLAVMPILHSCGELFDVDEAEEPTDVRIAISRDSVYIMPGDSLRLTVSFSSETAGQMGVLWLTSQPDIVGLRSDTIVGRQCGEALVTAVSADGTCADTCVVNVMKPWVVHRDGSFFDTVVYADVSVDGRGLDDGIMVGAFVDDELRGLARLRQANGISYAEIRVYGPVSASSDDVITFRCYDRREARLRSFDVSLPFDGETHGTLSNLVRLHITQ